MHQISADAVIERADRILGRKVAAAARAEATVSGG